MRPHGHKGYRLLHPRFVFREAASLGGRSLLFVLCVALAMAALTTQRAISEKVGRSLAGDARKLHAADIIIGSSASIAGPIAERVATLRRMKAVEAARTYSFYSMVRPASGDASLLSDVKAVEGGYPFYGEIQLRSGRDFRGVLEPGSAIVEGSLLERLDLREGDTILLGRKSLVIADVVEKEPDRPVDLFSFGPRLFINASDLEELDLIKKGSRVGYALLLRVLEEKKIASLARELRGLARDNRERVDTFESAPSRVKRFVDQFLFYLGLIALFTMVLAGAGIQSTSGALLLSRYSAIAVLKALGARSRVVIVNYLILVLLLGSIGGIVGTLCGVLLSNLLLHLAEGVLPAGDGWTFSWRVILESQLMGVMVIAVFSYLPLLRLRTIRPLAILRQEPIRTSGKPSMIAAALIFLAFFSAMVYGESKDVGTTVVFLGGVFVLLATCALVGLLLLRLLKRINFKKLAPRLACRGLARPGSSVLSVIVTLAASASFIFTIFLIEKNLNRSFVASFPEDAPNLYFIDIQPDQLAGVKELLGGDIPYFPNIRARVAAINGRPIDRDREITRRGDNLAREFSLTYREELLPDEILLEGKGMFRADLGGTQVSVIDYIAESSGIRVGDVITFRILGMPLDAVVSSIRGRVERALRPFFVFVFQEETLKEAPKTFFAGIAAPRDEIAAIQKKMTNRFPNITAINVSAAIEQFSLLVDKLSRIVHFFGIFSLLAGVLLMLSSLAATRAARVREAVYYKLLGAKNRFVARVFLLENIGLGLVSGLTALILSQTAAWLACSQRFEIGYSPLPAASLALLLGLTALVALIGHLSSMQILREKPVRYLAEQ